MPHKQSAVMGVRAPPPRITFRALALVFAALGVPALGLAALLDFAMSLIPHR